jgi:hypothetical protein
MKSNHTAFQHGNEKNHKRSTSTSDIHGTRSGNAGQYYTGATKLNKNGGKIYMATDVAILQ